MKKNCWRIVCIAFVHDTYILYHIIQFIFLFPEFSSFLCCSRRSLYIDPFFMNNAEDEENETIKHKQDEEQNNFAASEFSSLLALANEKEKAASSTNGKGPTPKKIENVQEHESDWVWDGIVIEDAHMDLY